MEQAAFEPLPMRRRAVAPISHEEYRIIARTGEVKEVQANTAYEAFKQSGFTDVIKIERKAIVRQPVLTKARFMDDPAAAHAPNETLAASQPLFQRSSPVVSADDLDSMIRRMNVHEAATVVDKHEEPVQVTNPMGMEVHRDGFDEIIPATVVPTQPTTLKAPAPEEGEVLPANMPQAAPAELPPEQALSQDEINKLLNG